MLSVRPNEFESAAIEKGNSHELPNSIFVNLKSNTIMKKPQCKDTAFHYIRQINFNK